MRESRLLIVITLSLIIAWIAGCKREEPSGTTQPSQSLEAAAPAAMDSAVATAPAPGPDIPFVVPPPQAGHKPFADFAWREFIALNWPSQTGSGGVPVRGQPDRTLQLGDALDRPRVWETWKTDWELMGFGGASPPQPSDWSDWNTPGLTPCPGMTLPPGIKVLTSQGTTSSKIRGLNQAFIGPLLDQSRNYARYEIRVGQNEYETIRNNKWFIAANIPNPVTLDASRPDKYGAIELKAAWRELEQGEDGSRFYNVAAWKLDPGTLKCVQTRAALVGFHIAHKTAPFTEWVWSTFEHVDNVPPNPPGTPSPGTKYSFNNRTGTPPSPDGFDRIPTQLNQGVPLPAKNDPARNPVQVTRFEPTPPEVAQANQDFRSAAPVKGTVWANYVLVNNQWPTNPGSFKIGGKYPQEAGQPFPLVRVANTTMETYFQNKQISDSTNSCMSCHYLSARRDFSFLFADAWRKPTPPAALNVAPPVLPEELRAVEDAVKKTKSHGG
jgi:hypothetical protein